MIVFVVFSMFKQSTSSGLNIFSTLVAFCITLYMILVFSGDLRIITGRPVTRISQGGVQLDLVDDHSSGGLGAQPPDADNNLIFDVL